MFRGNPPSIVHAHYGIEAAQHRQFADALKCPLVASFYGYDATQALIVESPRWRARYRRLFQDVAAVIVEGPAMAARISRLGCPTEKIAVVRLPADADSLHGIDRVAPEEFVVVVAGRCIEKKGFDTAIRAFAKAFAGRPARLLVVGDGPLLPELRKLSVSEGIGDQVEWAGSLPFREFMARVATASVALFPSREAHDGDSDGGAPVTLIETQWLGVPVIVSNHDDLPFVADHHGALVLPALDPDPWADALESLAADPTRLAVMGETGQAFVREHHSPLGNARAREAVYQAAADGRKSA